MAILDFPNPNPASGFGTQMAAQNPTLVLGQIINAQSATATQYQLPSAPVRFYCPAMALAADVVTGVIREALPQDNIIGVIMSSILDGNIIPGLAGSDVPSNQPYQPDRLVAVAGNGNTIVMWASGAIVLGTPVVYWTSSQSGYTDASTEPYGQVVSINDPLIAQVGAAPVPFGVATSAAPSGGGYVLIQLTGTPSSNINNSL